MKKQFYQQIRDNRWVLDFHKIAAERINVWVIISARESQGKTINAIQYVRERYLKTGETALLCFNTEDMWPLPDKLIGANKEFYPKDWDNVAFTKKGLIDTKTKKVFLHFANVNTSYKFKVGNRDPKLRTLIYDEFNEGTAHLGEKQHLNFDSLLRSAFQTYADPEIVDTYRVFILGNNLTAASPLLTQWKIYRLPKDEIQLYNYEGLDIMLFNPRTNIKDNQKEWNTKKNWLMGMSKLNNTYNIAVIGDKFLDNNDNVIPENLLYLYKEKQNFTLLKVSDNHYLQQWYNKNNQYLFSLVKDHELNKIQFKQINCFRRELVDVGVNMVRQHRRLKDFLMSKLANNTLFFDCFTSKLLLIKNLL